MLTRLRTPLTRLLAPFLRAAPTLRPTFGTSNRLATNQASYSTSGVTPSSTSTSTSSSSSSSSSLFPSVGLNALDFPYLKSNPRVSTLTNAPLDWAKGTTIEDAPLLIMHGLLGSAGNWRTTAPKLASHRRILSLDLRNHGASPHVADMRFRSCAADVVRLMDERGIDKAIVLGHSLGGKVAMATGLLHPDRIVSVISVDMAPQNYNLGQDGWTGVNQIVEACAQVPLSAMRSRSEVDIFLKPLIPDFMTRAFVLQNIQVQTVTNEAGEKVQSVAWRCNLPLLRSSLPQIATFNLDSPHEPFAGPALFVGGGNSPYLTIHQADSLKQHFPNHEWENIPGAGHWVHVEKPNEFVEIVRGYLKKLETPKQQ